MSEYGANHNAYQSLLDAVPSFKEPQTGELLQRQLQKSVEVLDITEYQMNGLRHLGLTTIGDVLHASETKLQEIAWVGEKRSRRMRNTAMAAIFEYLSG
jgi:DNA-directed RNA polymerase alpha subunit